MYILQIQLENKEIHNFGKVMYLKKKYRGCIVHDSSQTIPDVQNLNLCYLISLVGFCGLWGFPYFARLSSSSNGRNWQGSTGSPRTHNSAD